MSDNLSLTDADRELGTYLMGVVKGYQEGYRFGVSYGAVSEPGPGGDASVADPSSRARFAARAAGGSTPSAPTFPDPESEAGDEGEEWVQIFPEEEPEESDLDAATRRGMVIGLRAMAEEFTEAGMVEAALRAERHADAMSVSTLRSFE